MSIVIQQENYEIPKLSSHKIKQAFELEINDEDKRVDRNHFQSLQDPKLQDLKTDFHPSGVVLKSRKKIDQL